MHDFDYSTASEFLADLFGQTTEHAVELRSLPNDRGGGPNRPLFGRDLPLVEGHCRRWDGPGRAMYFGVCTRTTGSPSGARADLAECPALWAEVDTRKLGLDKATVRQAVVSLPHPPSIVIDSGGGLHFYWLLTESLDVRAGLETAAETEESIVAVLKQLAGIMAGDTSVCDLARIMRLPGTHNTKPEVVATNNGQLALVTILAADWQRRHEFSDLIEWLDWQRPVVSVPTAVGKERSVPEDNPYLAAAARLGFKPPLDVEKALAAMNHLGNGDTGIHQTQLRVSAALVAQGVADDEIVTVLMAATAQAAGLHARTWNWRREERALRAMIATARAKFVKPVEKAVQAVPASQVVDFVAERSRREQAKPATGNAEPKPAKEPRPKAKPASDDIRLAGDAVVAVWREQHGPILSTGGMIWAYAGGIWRPAEGEVDQTLRVEIQRALTAIDAKPTRARKGDVLAYLIDHAELYRPEVPWNRRGLIVGANAVLDPEAGTVLPHDPEHYATYAIDLVFDPVADCPTLKGMLNAYFTSAGEAECRQRIEVLQEWFGSMLARGLPRDQKKVLWLHGDKRTGKSSLSVVARLLVGARNVAALDPCDLDEKFSLESLLPAAAWIADDVLDEDRQIPGGRFKLLANGEPVSVRRMNRPAITHRFDIPVMFTANSRPRFKDGTDASYDRVLPFRLIRSWSTKAAIPEDVLLARLREELPGIVNWAAAGLRRLRERKHFEQHPWMQDEASDFRTGNALVLEWIDECVTCDPTYRTEVNDLVAAMNGWRRANYGPAKADFGGVTIRAALKNRFSDMERQKSNGRVWYRGLRLSSEAEDWGRAERHRHNEGDDWRGSERSLSQPKF
jgi:P4 family phage/plasmid primase-like protien